MMKYGTHLQDELHQYLKDQSLKTVSPGFVYRFNQGIGDYRSVVYAVGIDGWYESSVELVAQTLHDSIEIMVADGCKRIATGAMATGFGKLSKQDFGRACAQVLKNDYEIESFYVVERNELGMDEIKIGLDL